MASLTPWGGWIPAKGLRGWVMASAFSGLALLWGCGADHGHDHDDDHAHEHGDEDGHDHDHGEEGHSHTANYGGELVPLGTEFANVEVKLEPDSGNLLAWIWDGCAEDPIRLAQADLVLDVALGDEVHAITLSAVADPLTGEEVGDTCHFSGQNESLKGISQFEGVVRSIEVKGEKFANVGFDYGHGDHD